MENGIPLLDDLNTMNYDIREIAFAIRSLTAEMKALDDLGQRKIGLINHMMSSIIEKRSEA